MFDEDPSTNQQLIDVDLVTEDIENMMYSDDDWVCPICGTNKHLNIYTYNTTAKSVIYQDFAVSIQHISDDIYSLTECIQLYDDNINTITNYTDDEISAFDCDVVLQPETVETIKKLIINDLKATQKDWFTEIENMRQQILLKATKL